MTPLAKATPQQRRVLEAWLKRGSMKGAAEELGISRQTAKNHMTALYHKTGATNRVQIFYWLGQESTN